MKSFLRAVTIAIAVLAATIVEAATESRVALVIGNARYPDAPLRNPANDARAMAATLRERGFEVILRVDANKQQMESAVIEFGEKLSEGATGLFFFAGHGMQVQGRNFLVPTDAKLTTEQRVKVETLDVEVVLDQMQGARSKVNVVILDSCRNNPFERRFRSASGGLAQINAPEGTLIAYATAPGRVAADGDGANGLYTTELLKALRAPGLKVEDVFKQVRINVARASNGGQTPWEASSLIGDFYFIPPAPAPSVAELEKARTEAIEKARAEVVEQTRMEIEKIRREVTEGARLEIEKARAAETERSRRETADRARLEAAEKVRVVATLPASQAAPASTPVQQAALPSPAAPLTTSVRFDGDYAAKFTMVGQNGFLNFEASLKITDTQLSGWGMISTSATINNYSADRCALTGEIDSETGEIRSFDVGCRYFSARLTGRFAANPASGFLEGNTEARSLADSRVTPVVWRGPKLAGVARAETPAPPVSDTERTRVATATVPAARVAAGSGPSPRFDGTYRAQFTMIAQDGFTPIDGSLSVSGSAISGFGSAGQGGTNADSCSISGRLDPQTGEIVNLGVTCRRLNAHFRGRFAVNPQSGLIEAKTEARAISDGRVVPVTWVMQ